MTPHTDDNGLTMAQKLDQYCDEFEAAWQQENSPNLSDYLQRWGTNEHPEILFQELLTIELQYRKQREETFSRDSYESQFPDFSSIILKVFERASESSQAHRQSSSGKGELNQAHETTCLNPSKSTLVRQAKTRGRRQGKMIEKPRRGSTSSRELTKKRSSLPYMAFTLFPSITPTPLIRWKEKGVMVSGFMASISPLDPTIPMDVSP